MLKFLIIAISIVSLASCSTPSKRSTSPKTKGIAKTPPERIHNNICKIYQYDKKWEDAAKKSAKRWGTPENILMAMVHQESRFVYNAKPQYRGSSTSSAYGYSQAQKGTWKEYQKKAKRHSAIRTNIYDAFDFIGWYNHNSYKRNRISKKDAQNLYLAYHEGNGGFSRKTYKNKPWLIKVSKKVKNLAATYQRQLRSCR